MHTFILIIVMISNSNTVFASKIPAGTFMVTQEFNSQAACVAAGEFATASSEELNEANSARYRCIAK